MNRKCYIKTDSQYKWYGAKGVTVCEEWQNDFMSYYNWCIANGWEKGLHLDKDILCNEQDIYPKVYSPTTCKFVTKSENIGQSNKDRHVTHN